MAGQGSLNKFVKPAKATWWQLCNLLRVDNGRLSEADLPPIILVRRLAGRGHLMKSVANSQDKLSLIPPSAICLFGKHCKPLNHLMHIVVIRCMFDS